MTNEELRSAIETLWPGHGGQTRAAEAFGISTDLMRAYLAPPQAARHRNVPDWLANDLRGLLDRFPGGIRQVDPKATLRLLHRHMVAAGFTDGEAAAGILGAAQALADLMPSRCTTLSGF